MAPQSYVTKVYSKDDYQVIGKGEWDFINGDVLLCQPWKVGESLEEDITTTIPLRVFLPDLPKIVWSEDAIVRACSALRRPFSVKAVEQVDTNAPPT